MADRTIVLLDGDSQFESDVKRSMAPYGFSVSMFTPELDSLESVKQLEPTLLIIAVEEPDKQGFRVYSKARRSVAKNIPVVLVTSSVSSSGFATHKQLKSHADAYLDKRELGPGDIATEFGALIDLGNRIIEETVDEEVIEEMDEFEVVDEEVADFDSDDSTRVESGAGAFANFTLDQKQEDDDDDDDDAPPPTVVEEIGAGLDAVAEMAEVEQSGIHDRRAVMEMQSIKRENKRLKLELQASQRVAKESSSATFSREREFLNLRETINKKERELLALRDELGEKERQILDTRERIRELEHARATLDQKNLDLEQSLLAKTESEQQLSADLEQKNIRVAAIESDLQQVKEQMSQELATADETNRNLERTHAEQLAEIRTQNEETFANAQRKYTETLREVRDSKDAEIDRLQTDLDRTADEYRRTSGALQARETELGQATQAIAILEDSETRLRAEVAQLEDENGSLQDQALEAYKKIQAHETTITKAKKAAAIALTVLDEGSQGIE